MNRTTYTLLAAVALIVAAAATYWLWPRPAAPVAEAPVVQPVESAPPTAPVDAATLPDPEIVASTKEPVPEPGTTLPALPQSDPSVQDLLVDLLGKPAVLSLLQTDGFVRRLVATVDNLSRPHATSKLWPVNPTTGRFTVADGSIAPANAARYETFVKLVDGIDPARAAALYRRMYPLLQQAYEELGYPNRRFHGRLLAVIDHLLATPQRPAPLAVTLTEVKGPIASERPWVRYEFVDPQLQALSSGQKIMLRVGDAHRRRLADWLTRFRAEIER